MSTQVRPFFPALASLWGSLDGLSSILLRVGVGGFLLPHGFVRLFGGGIDGTAQFMAKAGLQLAYLLTYYVTALEIIGGILLVLGLLTRPIAALVFGFMVVGVFVHWNAFGYFWTAKGAEVPLSWAIFSLVLLIKGAGPYSIDHKIGREI